MECLLVFIILIVVCFIGCMFLVLPLSIMIASNSITCPFCKQSITNGKGAIKCPHCQSDLPTG